MGTLVNLNTPVEGDAGGTVAGLATLSDLKGASLDLRAVLGAIKRDRLYLIGILATALACAIAVSILSTRIYSAQASVQIDQQRSAIIGDDGALEPVVEGQEVERYLQTQVDILRSRALAQKVADDLGLYRSADFATRMNRQFATEPAPGKSIAETRRGDTVDILRDQLTVDLPRTSRIVTISFKSPDPALARQIADAYAEAFIASSLVRRFESSRYARQYLQEQLGLAKQRLEKSEKESIAYARSAGLLDTNQLAPADKSADGDVRPVGSLTTSNLVQINQELIAARAARIEAQQKWQQASSTPLLSLPEVQADPSIQNLLQERAGKRAEIAENSERHREDFPAMRQATARLKELDVQIDVLARNIRSATRERYEVARGREDALAGQVASLRGETLSEQSRAVRYNLLKRETDANRQMYDALLQRARQLNASAGVTDNNLSILDRAELPELPIAPRPIVNQALGLAAGFIACIAFLGLRNRLLDEISTPEDIAAKLAAPMLAVIPMLPRGTDPVATLKDKLSSLTEAYHVIRTKLDLASSRGRLRSVLVTSGRASEGKSTSAFALAIAFASANRRVLVIDGDMRRPSLHKLFDIRPKEGLSNILAQQAGLEDCLIETSFAGLSFLPAGQIPPNPSDLLAGDTLRATLAEALERFDLVLVDGPPVLGISDALVYGQVLEGTIFVVASGRGRASFARDGLRRLSDAGANIVGTVLTMFDARRMGLAGEYEYYHHDYSYRAPAADDVG